MSNIVNLESRRQPDPFLDHFGTCPECGNMDGRINVGRGHWFYCLAHRTCWYAGSNLFSDWRDQTEDEQRAIYDGMAFDTFREVKIGDVQ